jgi:hypothetical protein
MKILVCFVVFVYTAPWRGWGVEGVAGRFFSITLQRPKDYYFILFIFLLVKPEDCHHHHQNKFAG